MKKKLLLNLFVVLTLIGCFAVKNNYQTVFKKVNSKLFLAGEESVTLTVGTYTSSDNHTIKVNEDGTILYDDTYSLTATASDRGYVISGKIGTNNKAVTFYQLNDSNLVSGGVINYTHGGSTVYLYDYTVFSMNVNTVVDNSGVIDLYHDGNLVNKYNDLQSAVDSASSGDTIHITANMDVIGGVYINKNLTIEGNSKTLNAATWANGVFVIESGAKVTINNLTVEGGATGFEVDYDSVTFTNFTIPLKNGSDSNDIKQNLPVIISRGNLNVTDSSMNNNYTSTAGGVIRVLAGTLNVSNSKFNHNRASNGGAISVGSNFQVNKKEYPVENVKITGSEFKENYSGNGGAVYAYNVAKIEVIDTKFDTNTVTGGYGGAFMINKQSSNAVKLGLDFVQARIDNCEFVDNWVGNDGFAVQNYDAELTTTNTKFIRNVGVHPSSSVATYSMQVSRTEWANESISNSYFEENSGAISSIADHGGHVFLNIDNCKFTKNIGSSTLYFLTSIINISNCEFVDEQVNVAVLDTSSYSEASEYTGLDYNGPRTTVKDCNFSNNNDKDMLTRVRGAELKYDLVIEGEVNGNVEVRNGTNLIVNGTLNGNVVVDRETANENIQVKENGKVNGNISYMSNHYRLNIRYNFGATNQIDGYDLKSIYLEENKTYTAKELYMMHFIGKEDAKLEYYTDSSFTTLWNYSISANTTVYAKWLEHEHVYDQELIVYDNAIYQQCECGYLGKKVSLSAPNDTYYTGNGIEVIVNNEFDLEGYTIKYQAKDIDGKYVDMEGVPTKVGDYKVILTYDDLVISTEYAILEKVVNPSTGLSSPYIILSIILIGSLIFIKVSEKKKYL